MLFSDVATSLRLVFRLALSEIRSSASNFMESLPFRVRSDILQRLALSHSGAIAASSAPRTLLSPMISTRSCAEETLLRRTDVVGFPCDLESTGSTAPDPNALSSKPGRAARWASPRSFQVAHDSAVALANCRAVPCAESLEATAIRRIRHSWRPVLLSILFLRL